MIRISVVIPTYNRQSVIGRCLQSVFDQTYKPMEIIVVDDGSCDQTRQVVNQYEKKGTIPIVYIYQDKTGAQAARNNGIRHASGDYIAFLDSDDEWLPMKTEIQLKYLKNDVVVYSDCYVKNDMGADNISKHTNLGRRYAKSGCSIWKSDGGDGYVYKDMLVRGGPTFPSIIVSKEALLNIGYLDERVQSYQEWDTSIMLARRYRFVHVHEPLFIYYLHDGGTISKDLQRDINGRIYIIDKYRSDIKKLCGKNELQNKYMDILFKCVKCKSDMYFYVFFRWLMAMLF